MASKKELVYSRLKEAIISHDLEPGEILNEGEIASQYGVSKTPVREALCELAFERYVNPIPRTGHMVTHITNRDIREAYHLRQLLEVEAAGLAARRIGEAEIAELERLVETSIEMTENKEASKFADRENLIARGFALNQSFHLTIARASGSQRLAALIEQLLDEMRRILAYDPYLVLPGSNVDISEHGDVVDALRQRDPAAAREAMTRHMEKGRTRILERF